MTLVIVIYLRIVQMSLLPKICFRRLVHLLQQPCVHNMDVFMRNVQVEVQLHESPKFSFNHLYIAPLIV